MRRHKPDYASQADCRQSSNRQLSMPLELVGNQEGEVRSAPPGEIGRRLTDQCYPEETGSPTKAGAISKHHY